MQSSKIVVSAQRQSPSEIPPKMSDLEISGSSPRKAASLSSDGEAETNVVKVPETLSREVAETSAKSSEKKVIVIVDSDDELKIKEPKVKKIKKRMRTDSDNALRMGSEDDEYIPGKPKPKKKASVAKPKKSTKAHTKAKAKPKSKKIVSDDEDSHDDKDPKRARIIIELESEEEESVQPLLKPETIPPDPYALTQNTPSRPAERMTTPPRLLSSPPPPPPIPSLPLSIRSPLSVIDTPISNSILNQHTPINSVLDSPSVTKIVNAAASSSAIQLPTASIPSLKSAENVTPILPSTSLRSKSSSSAGKRPKYGFNIPRPASAVRQASADVEKSPNSASPVTPRAIAQQSSARCKSLAGLSQRSRIPSLHLNIKVAPPKKKDILSKQKVDPEDEYLSEGELRAKREREKKMIYDDF